MTAAIQALAVLLAGPLVGCEIAVAVFLHPLLSRLPDDAFRAARSAGADQLGRVMPFWYAATLALLVAAAVVAPGGYPTWLIGSAAAVMVLVLVVTIAMMVPLNNRIANYPADQPAHELRQSARLWDRLHWRRVALLVIMLVLVLVGIS